MDFKFSVLISVYFKEIPKYLDRSLKSITDDQILKPDEIVLVKDGPLTEELDIVIEKYVEKYPNLFKIIPLEKNMGLGKALNIGIENCSHEFIARMDGDDISKPERFLKQIEVFKKNPGLGMIGSWIDEFKEEGIINSLRKVPETHEEIYEKLKFLCAFNHPTVMYKKSEVEKAGSYLQKFALEDHYLWGRMAISGCKFYNIQESLVEFRITDGTAKRRGGLKLLKSDIALQNEFMRLNFSNRKYLIKTIIVFGIYRLIPWKIREILQKKIMRNTKEIK